MNFIDLGCAGDMFRVYFRAYFINLGAFCTNPAFHAGRKNTDGPGERLAPADRDDRSHVNRPRSPFQKG